MFCHTQIPDVCHRCVRLWGIRGTGRNQGSDRQIYTTQTVGKYILYTREQ